MRQGQGTVWGGAARRTRSTPRQDRRLLSVQLFVLRVEGALGGVIHVWMLLHRHCPGSFPNRCHADGCGARLQIWHGPDLEASPPAHNWLEPVGPIDAIVA